MYHLCNERKAKYDSVFLGGRLNVIPLTCGWNAHLLTWDYCSWEQFVLNISRILILISPACMSAHSIFSPLHPSQIDCSRWVGNGGWCLNVSVCVYCSDWMRFLMTVSILIVIWIAHVRFIYNKLDSIISWSGVWCKELIPLTAGVCKVWFQDNIKKTLFIHMYLGISVKGD